MRIRVVADSSGNIFPLAHVETASAPLRITVGDREFVDVPETSVDEMMRALDACEGPTSTACPSLGDWLDAFDGADCVFAITITSALSGSYNSACAAAREYMHDHPGRRVYVVDSLSTGPEMQLIAEKFDTLIGAGADFDTACREAHAYLASTRLNFILGSLGNLARNGRVSMAVAKLVGLLDIRFVGTASEKGELESLGRARGDRKSRELLWKCMLDAGYSGGKVRIRHTENASGAARLRQAILELFPAADVQVDSSRCLCAYYGERYGILVGFETIPQKNAKKTDLDLAGALRRAAEVQGRIKDSVDRLSEKIADWNNSGEDR